jgi:hypothetical protein
MSKPFEKMCKLYSSITKQTGKEKPFEEFLKALVLLARNVSYLIKSE